MKTAIYFIFACTLASLIGTAYAQQAGYSYQLSGNMDSGYTRVHGRVTYQLMNVSQAFKFKKITKEQKTSLEADLNAIDQDALNESNQEANQMTPSEEKALDDRLDKNKKSLDEFMNPPVKTARPKPTATPKVSD